MRKIILTILLFIMTVLLVSCSKPAAEISIDNSKVELGVGESHEITYSISNATGNVTYEVADTSILAIEGSVIKGLKEGSTTVNVKIVADDKAATSLEVTINVNVVENRKVTIKFESDTKGFTLASESIKYGTNYTLPKAPDITGYTFKGYSVNGSTSYVNELTNVTSDTTVKANYELITYTVTLVIDDETKTEVVNYGEEIDLKEVTKEGYEFLGWAKEEKSTSYFIGKQAVSADITYYAQFSAISYTITYDLDGGTLYSRVKFADYGTDLTLPTPIKTGADFLGWTLEKGTTNYIEKLENVSKDTTVYANWSAKTYTVTYELNGGTATGLQTSIKASDTLELPAPTKDGYTFLGWSTSEYSTSFLTELKGVSANMTLYAHYTDGIVANPTNIESVIANASEGAKIILLAGDYTTLTVNKKVTLEGPNAGVDPVNEERGAEATFSGKITITASGVVIDGIEIEGESLIFVNNADDVTIKNVLITESVVANIAGAIAPLMGVTCKNLVITSCKLAKSVAAGSKRLMAFYGFNLENFTVTYCSFTSTYSLSTFPDGIKIASDNTGATDDKFKFGIKGNVEISHNHFEDFPQYTIWFKDYKEGTYNIYDNTAVRSGRGDSTYYCPLVRLATYSGDGEATVNIMYNTVNNSDGLLRVDAAGLTNNVTCNLNNNIVIGRISQYDIVNSSTGSINAQYNYDDNAITTKGSNVDITNACATVEEVKTYAMENSKTYNITYELNGGTWDCSYYSATEIGEQFCADYGHSITYSTFDTAHTSSSYIGDMLNNETYKTKWMWLLKALYELAGDGDETYNPETCDFSVWGVKGFYFANLYGFFNTCSHHESNLGSDSYDFSDPETGKAICALGPAKGYQTGAETYQTSIITELSIPSKENCAFLGWKTQDGKIIKNIPASMTGDLSLSAVWESATVADSVIITNMPENGIKLYETLQLEWNVIPSNAYNKNVIFFAVDSDIFTITEEGLITAKSVGTGKLRIKLEDNPDYELYVDIIVWSGEYFDVSYETESYVDINGTIKLNAAYIDENSKAKKVEWESLSPEFATVDANGVVKALAEGLATIRAKVIGNADLYFDFYVTVLPEDMSDAMEFVVKNHNSNALTVYNLGIGAGTPVYYYDFVGSVNQFLFNDELQIDRRYYNQLAEGVKNNGKMKSVEFITVHYTGNMNKGADADNNCDYFNNLDYQASIHYVTGRTNLTDITGLESGYSEDAYLAFAGLSEEYAGWHASDTSQGNTVWSPTGVKVAEDDPEKPVISVENGMYTINGKATTIAIPTRDDGIVVTGPTFEYNGTTCNTINSMGLAWKVVDGEYYMGNTYWGSQAYGKALCSIGGNWNSIGIESCVDIGSDLEHTWHVTAQLVANIMVRYDLDISRVVGHHFFSGKDCPQPMLENDMQLWYQFLEMVQAEYDKLTTYKDDTISAKAVNSDGILRDNGLLVQDAKAHCVTYEVTVNGKTITLATCVESYYKCSCERTAESLQMQGYEIK